MRFVEVELGQDQSVLLSPEPYLQVLPELLPQLPDGAKAFVTDSAHYDFASSRCVKDLRIGAITVREVGHATVGLVAEFDANEFKHDARLVVHYQNVTRFDLAADLLGEDSKVWPESRRLGDVQLDEILPVPGGCSHEVKMTGGTMLVECGDLRAEWIPLTSS
ncbi:hypothetical protein [Lentzea terrae]|uniref:hypothetical protein n=1 Tax=Lentzea terrae TaxID=2200761 RepID=UPI000DD2FA21|nr:hypothetical protein [Lentzea terrae]